MVRFLGGSSGSQDTSALSHRTLEKYKDTYHSHQEIAVGLMKFKEHERDRIIELFKDNHMWGAMVSDAKLLMAIQDNLGSELARKFRIYVLLKDDQESELEPEQIKRNINRLRYERNKELEPGRIDKAKHLGMFIGSNSANKPRVSITEKANKKPEKKEVEKAKSNHGFAGIRPVV